MDNNNSIGLFIVMTSILMIFTIGVFVGIKRSSVDGEIKSGELIILGNSSYKCKQVNTLEEK